MSARANGSLPSSTVAYEISTRSGNGDGERLDWCWLLKTSNFSTISMSNFLSQFLDLYNPPSPTNTQSPPQNYVLYIFLRFGNHHGVSDSKGNKMLPSHIYIWFKVTYNLWVTSIICSTIMSFNEFQHSSCRDCGDGIPTHLYPTLVIILCQIFTMSCGWVVNWNLKETCLLLTRNPSPTTAPWASHGVPLPKNYSKTNLRIWNLGISATNKAGEIMRAKLGGLKPLKMES